MKTPVISFRKFAVSGKRTWVVGVCVCAGLAGSATSARAQTPETLGPSPLLAAPPDPPSPTPIAEGAPVIPNHLVAGNQIFEANLTGLRAYLESIKGTDPRLYAQLAPDVERLESKRTAARTALVAGVVAGLAAGIYGFAGRPDCQEPSINDPDFAAKSDAWGACNEHNIKMMATFGFIGVGAIAAGAVAAWALAPSRSDLLDVINENNRQSREPLRLQLGYDPSRDFAFAGAALTF